MSGKGASGGAPGPERHHPSIRYGLSVGVGPTDGHARVATVNSDPHSVQVLDRDAASARGEPVADEVQTDVLSARIQARVESLGAEARVLRAVGPKCDEGDG